MKENILSKELKSEYIQYHHHFDYWSVNFENNKTYFYILGKLQFSINRKLSQEEIIENMNIFEFVYKNAFDDGVKQTQTKIKNVLGLEEY